MRFPEIPPTTQVSYPPPGLPALLGVIDALAASLAGLRVAVESTCNMGAGRLLTCEEFIQRIGGKLTVETLQDWIKNRRHGRFRHVQDFGKAGYRIPEAYVHYTDEQIDQLFGGVVRGATSAAPPSLTSLAATATATEARPTHPADARVGGARAAARGRGRLGAVARHPAEALLEGVLDD